MVLLGPVLEAFQKLESGETAPGGEAEPGA